MSQQLKFKNLQPVAYLKTFNKMLDHYEQTPLRQPNPGQLRIPSLSRFPLPEFYYNMEGIFENPAKKKVKEEQKNIQQIQEEEFMINHNEFMKRTIAKIIVDSEDQQRTLEKRKKHYQTPPTDRRIIKIASQSKIRPKDRISSVAKQILNPETDHSHKEKTVGDENILSKRLWKAKKGGRRTPEFTNYKRKNNGMFRERLEGEIESFLESRKKFFSESKMSHGSQGNPFRKRYLDDEKELNDEEKRDVFLKGIVSLQHQQNKMQKEYTVSVESTVSSFHEKVDLQIKRINSFKFW